MQSKLPSKKPQILCATVVQSLVVKDKSQQKRQISLPSEIHQPIIAKSRYNTTNPNKQTNKQTNEQTNKKKKNDINIKKKGIKFATPQKIQNSDL
jgi:hypothetical protein